MKRREETLNNPENEIISQRVLRVLGLLRALS